MTTKGLTRVVPPAGAPLWLAALSVTSFAVGTDDFVIAGVLRPVAQDLDVSAALAGQLVTAFSLTYAIAAPIAAVALARLPQRAVMVGVTLLIALLNVAPAVAPTFGLLMVVRVLAAVAAAVVDNGATA